MPARGERPHLSFNAVIYATDFSVCSQNAGLYAALIAKRFSSQLLVAHAFTLSQAAMEVEIEEVLLSSQRRDLQLLLSEKASALASGSIQAIPILLEGDPKDAVPSLAKKHQPCLVVLGTHGGGWIERELIGSVAEAILRSARGPALTVGPQVRAAASASLRFRRILFATDLSPAAAGAAASAVSFAQAFEAEIDVLNVVQREAVNHPDRLSEITRRFYSALDAIVPEQANHLSNPRTFVEVGNAHERILKHIQERSIDLLILAIEKVSDLGVEMRTSGIFPLILHAECPVMTITGDAAT